MHDQFMLNVISQRLFDNCDGECGASTEYVADVDPSDTISLMITQKTKIGYDKHHAFFAGITKSGRRAYVFSVRDQNDLEFFGHGPTVRQAHFFRRDDTGAHVITGPFCSDKDFFVPVLRYDPDAYYHCLHYATKRDTDKVRIDPTGPFFWKFNKFLSSTTRIGDLQLSRRDKIPASLDEHGDDASLDTDDEEYYDAVEGPIYSGNDDDWDDEGWVTADEGDDDQF